MPSKVRTEAACLESIFAEQDAKFAAQLDAFKSTLAEWDAAERAFAAEQIAMARDLREWLA